MSCRRRASSNSHKPWHRGSTFGPGRRCPLDRNQRARWRYSLHCHTRAGRITAKGEWALLELEAHLSRDGRCDPSHARLAGGANVSERTVERALNAAQLVGLVLWERRLTRTGWRAEQISNAYVLILPGEGAAPPPTAPPPATDKQAVQPDSSFIPTGELSLAEKAKRRQMAFAEEWQKQKRESAARLGLRV